MATTLHRSLPFRLSLPLKSSLTPALIPRNYFSFSAMAANATSSAGDDAERIEVESDVKVEDNNNDKKKKKIFVAGSTGRTGKRIVERLLSGGYGVRAGALDLEKARSGLPQDPGLQIVRADVTEGSEKLAEAIGDAEAVICATGFRYSWDIFAPWKVDNFGTVNLVEACRKIGVNRFILVSSILVNGAAMGQILNPAYIILNVFGLTLIAKLQAEQYIRRSGINYTIIRPGGLRDEPATGNIIMEPEDTLYEGSISRDQVAEVAVGSLCCPDAFYKVVEIVSRSDAPNRPVVDLFAAVRQS
ncbi:NmrA-like family [Musa troglodytarum]|uniref:NmrA-like family n=1 Tax=Musa troglodytarum TaxID=320322 RepID=A0A9E7FM94_9LILI|nr:NmrA-like family [Musa troglodytarum]